LCQERARFLLEQREEERREAEQARKEELEEERLREERRDDMRLGAAALREPAYIPLEVVDLRCQEELDNSFMSTTSTASTLVLANENFVMDEVSLLTYTLYRISITL